ncbi:hypothetical protein A2U01_0088233, partial [Trifolium medium]|nr:hypothetical protein [Trifolium medium]
QPVLRRAQGLCCVGGFLLAAASRAGVTCAARSIVVVVGLFWFLRHAQAGVALRADPYWLGLTIVDF